jgi:hypothetical protein
MNRRNRATDGPGTPTGAALFRQAQAGCRDSLAQLMAAHEGLVHAVVRRQALGCLPFAEAVQGGRIGLWRAILGFDPQRGDGLLHLRLDLYYAPCLAGGQARRAHPRTGGELPFLRPGSRCGAGRRGPYPGLGGNRHSVHPSGTRSPAAVAPTDRCPGLLWVEWHLPSDLPPD